MARRGLLVSLCVWLAALTAAAGPAQDSLPAQAVNLDNGAPLQAAEQFTRDGWAVVAEVGATRTHAAIPQTRERPAAVDPGHSHWETLATHRARVIERARHGVVAVQCVVPTGHTGYYGAGIVVLDGTWVLTAASAAPPFATQIYVQGVEGKALLASVHQRDEHTGCVLLRVHGQDGGLRGLPLGRGGDLSLGSDVLAAGNPHRTLAQDGDAYWSFGRLTGRYALDEPSDGLAYAGTLLETDAAVNPGCDGGPLLDTDGRVIGLLTLAYDRQRWHGAAIPTEALQAAFPLLRGVYDTARDETTESLPATLKRALVASAAPAKHALVRIHVPAQRYTTQIDAVAAQVLADSAGSSDSVQMPPSKRGLRTGVLAGQPGVLVTSLAALGDHSGPVQVELSNGRLAWAQRAGSHASMDLALLTFTAQPDDPAPLPLNSSSQMQTGQFVTVLGTPPGPRGEPTFDSGIISATERLDGRALQMDAQVNYGNVGGPVMDLEGRWVGLVTHVSQDKIWGQNSKVGFFTPVAELAGCWDQLLAGTHLDAPEHPRLQIQPAFGETFMMGVKIKHVPAGSAAWEAGLRPGDVITRVDGQPVRSWNRLCLIAEKSPATRPLDVQFVRDGRAFAGRWMLPAE